MKRLVSLRPYILGIVTLVAISAVPAQAQWLAGASGGIYYNNKIAIGNVSDTSGYSFLVAATAPAFALVANTGTNAAYATFVNAAGGTYFGVENSTGTRVLDSGGLPYALVFQSAPSRAILFAAGGTPRMTVLPSGFVGIGTNTPTTALDVVGSINVSGNIAAKYQDLAEWVPSGERLAPGTVVVLDREYSNRVMPSLAAYDTAVAGVVSEQPGIILGEAGQDKSIIATMGRVKVHVDASRAPIQVGDLLVSSGRRGVAMRSEPILIGGAAIHRPGTIIGKALEPLTEGEGDILVLLSLQ